MLLSVLSTATAAWNSGYFTSSVPLPTERFKILFLLPTTFKSHIWMAAPLLVDLARRGHEVHMFCDSRNQFKIPNVTCINHGVRLSAPEDVDTFDVVRNPLSLLKTFTNAAANDAEKMFNSDITMKVFERRGEYDLIVIDHLGLSMFYPFAHGTPFAILSCSPLLPCQSASLGNVPNPAFVSSALMEFKQPYGTFDRLKNIVLTLAQCYVYWAIHSQSEIVMSERFPWLPSFKEIERNASLHLVTSSMALDGPLALLPNQVPIAGLVLRPPQPLPKDILDFMSGNTSVIYISFGVSFIRNDSIPRDKKDILLSVSKKLPYKVIMNVYGQASGRSGNVLLTGMVPQQDILAHPNVKLFISHCGLAGVDETVYHGVPVIALPAAPEHGAMAGKLVLAGTAIQLSWLTLTEEILRDAVMEIMTNSSYGENMAFVSRVFRDQKDTALDRAVFWTEYAARFRGAPHLKSPARHLSWIEFLSLDFILLALVLCYCAFNVFLKVIRALRTKCVGDKNEKVKIT
ncbi:UDP-glycosyltransferase UGT5 isoform X2 [Hyalella azteca]|nr:UDP-glycosyltransferase UGT5 isoform X2 [Hyalella azteca]